MRAEKNANEKNSNDSYLKFNFNLLCLWFCVAEPEFRATVKRVFSAIESAFSAFPVAGVFQLRTRAETGSKHTKWKCGRPEKFRNFGNVVSSRLRQRGARRQPIAFCLLSERQRVCPGQFQLNAFIMIVTVFLTHRTCTSSIVNF